MAKEVDVVCEPSAMIPNNDIKGYSERDERGNLQLPHVI
jgi:hypothetical protein